MVRQPEGVLKDEGRAYLDFHPLCYVRSIVVGIVPGRPNPTKGVFDWVVFYMGRTVFVEWKRPGEDLSPEQRAFYENVKQCGCEAYIVHSLRELKEIFPPRQLQLL